MTTSVLPRAANDGDCSEGHLPSSVARCQENVFSRQNRLNDRIEGD
jgi:hypothetical protein